MDRTKNMKTNISGDTIPTSGLTDRETFLTTYSMNPVPTLVFDDETLLVFNEAAVALTGFPAKTILADASWRDKLFRKDFIGNVRITLEKCANDSYPAFHRSQTILKCSNETSRPVDSCFFRSPSPGCTSDIYIVMMKPVDTTNDTAFSQIEPADLYRSIFDNSIEGICIFQGDTIHTANKALLDLLGYNSFDEFGKKTLMEHIAPEYRKIASERIFRRQSGEQITYPFHLKLRHRNGDTRDVELSSNMILVGDMFFFLTTIRDITDSLHTEEALRRSEARYRYIFDNAGTSIWEYDISEPMKTFDRLKQDGVTDFDDYFTDNPDIVDDIFSQIRLVDVNEETLKLYGASSKEEMIGRFGKHYLPLLRKVYHGIFLAYLEGKESVECETLNETEDGRLINILLRVTFPSEKHLLNHAIVSVTDITERKNAEEALRNSEEKFRGFVEQSVDGIMLFNERGTIIEWNRGIETITGLTEKETTGKKIWDIQHVLSIGEHRTQDNLKSRTTMIQKFLENGNLSKIYNPSELTIQRTDGSKRFVYHSFFPIQSKKGTLVGAILRDITDLKRHENQRKAIFQLRDEVIGMESVREIEKVLGAIGDALELSGIDFNVCEINIIDQKKDPQSIKAYEITPSQGWRPYIEVTENTLILEFWRKKAPVYRRDLDNEDIYGERTMINNMYGFSVRSVLDIPFSYGTLAVNSEKPDAFSEKDISFLEEVAQILSEGFARAEDIESLMRSEERYRTFVEKPFDMIVGLIDKNLNVKYISPQIEGFTGYAPVEFIADRNILKRIIHEDDFPARIDAYNRAFAGETLQNLRFRIKSGTGEYLWFAETVIPIPQFDGDTQVVQIVLHNINERMIAEQKIQQSLEEKETLLREVHHRVKNNLQVITSLLMLQRERIEDVHHRDIFNESISRIHAMALLHIMLYRSENVSSIRSYDYINNICSNLKNIYSAVAETVTLTIETDDLFLDVDTAIPCGLIINELVSNSLKHAFPNNRNGEIAIDMISGADDTILLSVRDNGVGMPDNLVWTKTRSLGLKIVRLLALQQLKGTAELIRDNGTAFKIVFKR